MSLLRTLATALNARADLRDGEGSQPRDRKPGRASEPAADIRLDQGGTSLFVTAPDDLVLHVRSYGSRTPAAVPVVCLPGLARTAADFDSLATALATDPAQPRWVVALDYRGHGRSEYDSNPGNYGLRTDLADVSAVLAALEIQSAIFVGTSHGGVLALMLARTRLTAIAGLVLNDIGPVIEPRALLQIKRYMGDLPVPRDFSEGGEILRKLFGARFPKLTAPEWVAFARRTWRTQRGALVPDYDVRLARSLQLNLKHAPPTLWDEFDALAKVPLMIIRGANSTMLSAETMNGMLERRSALDIVVVADQGHAPLLEAPKLMRRIVAFAASCDAADGGSRPSCGSMDRYP